MGFCSNKVFAIIVVLVFLLIFGAITLVGGMALLLWPVVGLVILVPGIAGLYGGYRLASSLWVCDE